MSGSAISGLIWSVSELKRQRFLQVKRSSKHSFGLMDA